MKRPHAFSGTARREGRAPSRDEWRERILHTSLGRKIAAMIFQPRGAESGEVFLNQRRVFILPTRAGLMLAAMLIALLLGSINYSLSLGFALTFLVVGVAWVAMIHTFRNLAHLHLRPARVEPVFAGELADYRVVVRNDARFDRYALRMRTAEPKDYRSEANATISCDPAARAEVGVTMPVMAPTRGRQPMPRVTLETRFPLGLWRAWSYWQPDLVALVYPQPAPHGSPLPAALGEGRTSDAHGARGSEDFAGIRPYAAGDPARHIAWRAMAKNPEGKTLTKLFDGSAGGELWLDFDDARLQTADKEAALSLMTRWVLDCEVAELRYGLRMPGVVRAPDRGASHRAACLEALATHGL